MKKILFSLLSLVALAANSQALRLAPAEAHQFPKKTIVNPMDNPVKTLLCLDTIRYPQVKEQILYTDPIEPAFYVFEVWQADIEAFSQTFFNSGSGLSIRGIEFFGSNSAAGTISVRASIYSVNAQN
ncbi:MAG: hypothetical protein ACK45H_09405, partial [Bacteroidota bacterium]